MEINNDRQFMGGYEFWTQKKIIGTENLGKNLHLIKT